MKKQSASQRRRELRAKRASFVHSCMEELEKHSTSFVDAINEDSTRLISMKILNPSELQELKSLRDAFLAVVEKVRIRALAVYVNSKVRL